MAKAKMKRRLFEIVQAAKKDDMSSKIFDMSIISLIIINMIIIIAATFNIPAWLNRIFNYIEIFSVILFTAEYIVRVYTSDMLFPELTPFKARMRYIFSFMAIMDLLAILPFYIPFLISVDLRALRMMRILRLFRIFKVNRYTSALTDIGKVFAKKKSQLLSSVFVVMLLMIMASVIMYDVENAAQPEQFNNAFSALWWAIATLTTVGYGDIYPITPLGRLLSGIIAILGIGLVAVPTGIISAGFIELIDKNPDDEITYCPYCGRKIR
ncbi:MAG: ion transporter [Ruminococcus sp.]|nr:ion transporter [Ruminococcus sp.]